jgi:hypothetical protein
MNKLINHIQVNELSWLYLQDYQVLIYVMNKDYEIGSYLEKIVDKKSDGLESEAAAAPEATNSDYAADTTAVDTTA